MRLIFATYNAGKLEEIQNLGRHYNIDVVGLESVGAHLSTEETGETFEANARLKLEQAQAALVHNTDDWIAADDSGLMIDALGGEPGVKTRRWAGHEMTDSEIEQTVMTKLAQVPPAERTAHLVTVVALGKVGQNPLTFEGKIDGLILLEPDKDTQAIAGLPLARLFYISDLMKTYGQYTVMSPDERRGFLSQRGQAFDKVFKYMNELSAISGQFEWTIN